MILGTVLWWDKRDGNGILLDEGKNEFYASSDVLLNCNYLEAGDTVSFSKHALGSTACAKDITCTSLPTCESKYGCEEEGCQACCQHDERDHGVCLDCAHEDDGSGDIDDAMDSMEDR